MPEQPLTPDMPLKLLGKVSDRIGYELQKADAEKRPVTTFGLAKALWEGGFLIDPDAEPHAPRRSVFDTSEQDAYWHSRNNPEG